MNTDVWRKKGHCWKDTGKPGLMKTVLRFLRSQYGMSETGIHLLRTASEFRKMSFRDFNALLESCSGVFSAAVSDATFFIFARYVGNCATMILDRSKNCCYVSIVSSTFDRWNSQAGETV